MAYLVQSTKRLKTNNTWLRDPHSMRQTDSMLRRWRITLLVCVVLLGACSSTTFVYNRLDFLVPWYVGDYVDLEQEQETFLDELLAPFLAWHRAKELPAYIEILNNVESRLDQTLTGDDVQALFAELEAAWLRLEGESLDWLLDLGETLSDEQIAEVMEELWERQREFEEEYLDRSEEEFYQDSYENLKDSAKDYLGSLSDEQRQLLHESSRRLLRSDQAWLQEREDWLKELAVLLERKPQWQERVREAITARREQLSPDYTRIYKHNMGVIFELTAQILNSCSEPQDQHLRDRLSELRADLKTLVAQGANSAATDQG
jgi:hypothetical protein